MAKRPVYNHRPCAAETPYAERVRALLAEAFIAHIDQLWPAGRDQGSPAWIAANVDEVLATIERLYAVGLGDQLGAGEFVARVA